MQAMAHDESHERSDPASTSLPSGWEQSQDGNGTPYYINHVTKTTTWTDPRHKSTKVKSKSVTVERRESRGLDSLDYTVAAYTPPGRDLPEGWKASRDSNGLVLYFNQFRSTEIDPRAVLEKKERKVVTETGLRKEEPFVLGGGPLPVGWGSNVTQEGKVYFVDNIKKTTSWRDPRKFHAGKRVERREHEHRHDDHHHHDGIRVERQDDQHDHYHDRKEHHHDHHDHHHEHDSPHGHEKVVEKVREQLREEDGEVVGFSPQLPRGWEARKCDNGRVYFVDHIRETTTYSDPRKDMSHEKKRVKKEVREVTEVREVKENGEERYRGKVEVKSRL